MFKKVIQTLTILLGVNLMTLPSHSQPICTEDIHAMTKQLLEDLPNYTNRVIRRAQPLEVSNLQIRHIIAASQAEWEPLPLPQRQYTRVFHDLPTQLFFTTLERIYVQNQGVEIQGFHWLFLVETPTGWDFFFLFSANQTDQLLTPPRQSNQTAIATAIRLWLRDFQSSCSLQQ